MSATGDASEAGSLRRAIDRIRDRPVLLALGAASALATVLAVASLVPVDALVETPNYRTTLLAVAAWLLVYDAVLVVLKPAILPGLYALATDDSTPDDATLDDATLDDATPDDATLDDATPDDATLDDATPDGATLDAESSTTSTSPAPTGFDATPSTAKPLRRALTAIRRDYVAVATASLRARVASVGYALLFAPPIVGLVGVVATVVSAAGYWLGVLQQPPIEPFQFGLVLLVLAIWFAGKWPTALAEPLVVAGESGLSSERRDSGRRRVSPARAWRQSALLAWDRPRTAGLLAAQRLALGAVVFLAFAAAAFALPENQPRALEIALAATLVVGVASKTVEGVVVADGVDRLDLAGSSDGTAQPTEDGADQPASSDGARSRSDDGEPSSDPDRLVPPSRGRLPLPTVPEGATSRVAIAAVLLLALVAGTAAVRVTDVRPNPVHAGPAGAQVDDAASVEEADERYASARARTTSESRTATLERANRNWTGGAWRTGWRLRVAVDYEDRVAAIRGTQVRNGSATRGGRTYLTDGLYASRTARHDARAVLATERVGSWIVSAAPGFPAWVDTAPIGALPPASDGWTWVERDADPLVVAVEDPDAVQRVASEPVERRTYRNGSRIVARIDRETGRIESVTIRERSVTYRTDDREEVSQRLDVRRTIEYEYQPSIERPAAAEAFPLQYVWDAIYY